MQQTASAWAIASLFGNAGPRPRPQRTTSAVPREVRSQARAEAKSLFALVIGRAETVQSVRDSIRVDDNPERSRRVSARRDPVDAVADLKAKQFCVLVLEEFSKLTAKPEHRQFIRAAEEEALLRTVPKFLAKPILEVRVLTA